MNAGGVSKSERNVESVKTRQRMICDNRMPSKPIVKINKTPQGPLWRVAVWITNMDKSMEGGSTFETT